MVLEILDLTLEIPRSLLQENPPLFIFLLHSFRFSLSPSISSSPVITVPRLMSTVTSVPTTTVFFIIFYDRIVTGRLTRTNAATSTLVTTRWAIRSAIFFWHRYLNIRFLAHLLPFLIPVGFDKLSNQDNHFLLQDRSSSSFSKFSMNSIDLV